ncbi:MULTISPECIES: conjugal transfer protein TraH [unclassified Pseudoalteromonas]|uniref:conjugal transfer protein TraH n=1 Tax=unclassified Pseudoalteromonas TaxID=194690 RepID=UPI0016033CBA|nr:MULTISPECIES: conjugal transfer protein TraH [unclassified Pseudoalteromonas]MBB1294935.1 conjugal transfer protein TraH [Pseudoalteromonas sp. SR41-4]MBB1410904.1 conjugal transfer protein TraH [Pseudoalteromonas sp. SG44-17]
MMKLKRIGIFVSLCMLTSSLNANAGMKDLFDSYQNDLGPYQVDVASGNNWGVGQFSARWNQPTIDVVSLESPSMSVGCGGVDLYGGSFGLISGDELVQVGRAVAQGAAAYFFKLAINNICSTCAAEMENLQNKLQRFNELARNACAESQTFLANNEYVGEDRLVMQESLISSDMASKVGSVTSWAGSILGDKNTNEKKDLNTRKLTLEGNSVYQAVTILNPTSSTPFLDALEFKGDTQKKKMASMLMTLLGTKVIKFENGATDVDAEPGVDNTGPANYSDFIFGKTAVPIKIRSCGTETIPIGGEYRCLNVETETVSFTPLEMVVKARLVGEAGSPGIFAKYLSQTPLNAEEKRFAKIFTFPYVRWAVFAKENHINIDDIANYAATLLLRQLNEEIFNQVSKVYAMTASAKENMYNSGTSLKKEYEIAYRDFSKQYELVSKKIYASNTESTQALQTVVQISAITKQTKG